MVTLRKFSALSLVPALIGIWAVGSASADTPKSPANSTSQTNSAKSPVEVLELKIQNDQFTATDLGPAGPSLGDMDVYSGIALDKDGRRAGLGGGTCQVVRMEDKKRTTHCLITIELDRGSLTMQSLWTSGSTAPLDMAITGGTGAFSNARGTATYWDIGTEKERMRAEIQH
ncbi:allene oxide cyclase barrel-like domain-containing protein [Actinomycetota bacterium Odt1-20B]